MRALISGFVGACTLTATHQLVRNSLPDAPRLDKLGMQSLQKLLDFIGISASEEQLFNGSILGDLHLNPLYCAQVGDKKGIGTLTKGLMLGLTMGAGAVTLPEAISVDGKTTHKTPATTAMTLALYGLGGLSAALTAQVIGENRKPRKRK